jgi:hypothetical protein
MLGGRVLFIGGFQAIMSNQIIGRSFQNKNKRYAYRTLTVIAGAFLLVTAGSVAARMKMPVQAGSQEAATPKLAGQWQLNKDQSDDPREKMQAARGDSGGGGRGEGGGRNGGGRGQGGGGMMDEMSVLQIEQTDSNVKVTGKSGRVLAQIPAAAAPSGDNAGGGESEGGGRGAGRRATTSAQWQNGQLVTVTQNPRGKSTRTYSLSPDGKQLYVTTKMENERLSQPVTYRQVYDPATTKAGGNQ